MTCRAPENRPVPSSHDRPVRREKSCSTLSVIWAGFRFFLGRREKTFSVNRVKAQGVAREMFRDLLRAPFPGDSDRAIARHWSPRLGVSEKTVLNWLACTHSASVEDFVAVCAMHGIWETARIAVGEVSREDFMARMGQD